jgi:carbonic anhydrase/acetyltransferase-like protein (isoleucine patch superfamily)
VSEFGPEVVLDEPAYIHPTALIYGRARIGAGASLWPHSVVRAEAFEVVIGPYTNIQDHVLVHIGGQCGTSIGAYCSITHHSVVHAARIGDNCLIGINATVMDGCVIGDNCIVAGGSFMVEGTHVPDNSIVIGAPARVVKSRNNWVANRFNALLYHRNAEAYARGEHRTWDGAEYEAFIARELARLEAEFAALAGADVAAAQAD